MSTMLILGAGSDMARACVIEFAKLGWDFYFAGRNTEQLEKQAVDLRIRTQRQIQVFPFDCLDEETSAKLWEQVKDNISAVLCAVGMLGEQSRAQQDAKYAEQIIKTNFTGLLPVLSLTAEQFAAKHSGSIMVISSVAGDRGRASNYIYGSAKAGLSAFLSGLRQRLTNQDVHVMTILPGFVATKMVDGLDLPKALTAQPEDIAKAVVKGFKKRKSVIYTPFYWRIIMMIVKRIPEFIFKKMEKF